MTKNYNNFQEQFNLEFDKTVELLFNKYYTDLCRKAYRIVNNKEIAEDIVQDVFFKLWDKRNSIVIKTSLAAYLNRMVFNESIGFLRKNKTLIQFSDEIIQDEYADEIDENINPTELKTLIHDAIEALPPKCKTIFLLSRIEELTYKQIAEELGISIKTVENQMGKALKMLRKSLKYDSVLFMIYFSGHL